MKPRKTKGKIKPENDPKVHLNMSFEEAIKLAVNTPIKKTKITKKTKS
jgi:hypothetical protein